MTRGPQNPTRTVIPAARYGARLEAAQSAAATEGLSGLLIGVGPDLRYLAGYNAMPLERLTLLVIPPANRPTLLVPRLEATPARISPGAAAGLIDVVTWEETDDPTALVAGLLTMTGSPRERRRVAVSDRLWAFHVLRLQAAIHEAQFESASLVTRELRIVKDADEIELLRQAAQATDSVIEAVMNGPLIGRTETDVSREVRDRLVAAGHDHADFAIVGSGPNSASPHHEPGDRIIQAGEPVLFDIGAPWDGYGSDISRMVWLTGGDPAKGPDAEFLRIYELVRDAQDEAAGSARPGTPAERVDAVARSIIAGGGYGDHFIHRTGHGIGLEEHEDPYLVAGNDELLRPGMAFSIEPGVYLEGRYGVRIEDIMVAAEGGPLVLNQAARELLVVDGR